MQSDSSAFRKSTLFILYILGFIFAFTSALPAYINSSFLGSLTSEQAIGIFYTIGSIFSLTILILLPKILKKYGNYKVTVFLAILYFLNFLGLAFIQNTYLVLFCFLISGAMSTAIYFNLDVFIEHNSTDVKTGSIRSIYLTCLNLAWLLSPWLAGIIVGESSFRRIYLIVAIILLPIILIVSSSLKKFKDPEYKTFDVIETIKSINANKDIKNIIVSGFLLQFFYSWMIIYTPIYLNQYVGFDWGTIGIIFSIALLPFVFIQMPLGYLADKKIGEKEILTAGFIIMGISTAIIPLIKDDNFIVWALILFMTRVGAAMVEVMNDTYFFKKVSDKSLNVINLYRSVVPLAYIISPIITTILILFMPIGNIFYVLGLFMIFGLRYSLTIKDTK
ncbi:MAG: MFS transporter [Candidatus Paceibacterota bacterium]|jgi:MFS family permease